MIERTTSLTTAPILIGALIAAVIVIIAIVGGVRKKRRRIAAQEEFEAHAEQAGVEMAAPDAPAPPRPAPPSPAPSTSLTPHVAEMLAPDVSEAEEAPAPRPLSDEPIAAAVTSDGTAATLAADAETPGGPSPADGPVTQLKGLGPKVAARLGELGIDRVGQIASLDDAGVVALDAQMGPFIGRITRDRWVEQARLLASGDREGFERVFGRL